MVLWSQIRPSRFPYTRLLLSSLLVVGASLSGCSWFSSDKPAPEQEGEAAPDPEAKELVTSTTPENDAPEPELVRNAKRLYQSGMFSLARESFQSLHDRYPMGAYGPFSSLKLADAYYYDHLYTDASKRYEEFFKEYPGNSEAPYAKLQAARSLVGSSSGTGRDRAPLEHALEIYDGIVKEYAGTSFATAADKERQPVIETLEDYDRLIIDFYKRRENSAAVEARQKQFQDRWSSRMRESSPVVAASSVAEPSTQVAAAATAPPELVRSTPPQAPPNRAQNKVAPLKPPVIVAASLSPGMTSGQAPEAVTRPLSAPRMVALQGAGPVKGAGIPLGRIICRDGDPPVALIEIPQIPPSVLNGAVSHTVEPVDDVVTVPGIAVKGSRQRYNCFGEEDLRIGADGELQLESNDPVLVTTLNNPPRLLLSPVE